jgi:hypothetical protein
MKKFLKRHLGAILFILLCLFMAFSFYISPYRLHPEEDLAGGFLNLLFVTPSLFLMGWFICWEIRRAEGNKYSMEKTFNESKGFILFVLLIFLMVFSMIFGSEKPRMSDIPSVLDDPIVLELLSGLLVTITIFLAGWGLIVTENWSRSRKKRRLYRSQTKQSKFLVALAIGTWIVAVSLSIWFYFDMRNDFSGKEWLGSPLFGLSLLAVLMTAYYYVARNKAIQWTVHVVVYVFFLFLATTANMLTLARFVFGSWKNFQFMPLMGAFELILIVLGIHFSLKEKSRGSLFIFLVWTFVLFLLTTSTFAIQPFFGRIGYVVELGIGIWIGLLLVAYFGFRSRFVTPLDAMVLWAWSLCIGTSISMLVTYFVLLEQEASWPFYSIVGTFSFAVLVTALRISIRDHRVKRINPRSAP